MGTQRLVEWRKIMTHQRQMTLTSLWWILTIWVIQMNHSLSLVKQNKFLCHWSSQSEMVSCIRRKKHAHKWWWSLSRHTWDNVFFIKNDSSQGWWCNWWHPCYSKWSQWRHMGEHNTLIGVYLIIFSHLQFFFYFSCCFHIIEVIEYIFVVNIS